MHTVCVESTKALESLRGTRTIGLRRLSASRRPLHLRWDRQHAMLPLPPIAESHTMSSRAIQRLREERGAPVLDPELDDIEEEEGEDHGRRQRAFLAMMDDSASESEEEDPEEEEEGPVEPETKKKESNLDGKNVSRKDDTLEEEEEEDLDALLAEFESKDEAIEETIPSASWFHVIVSNLDARDLDIDYVMRTSLLGGAEDSARRSRQSFLFGPPRDGWVRPPHYIGGGMGMTSYDNVESRQLPWPYHQKDASLEETQWQDPKQWFTFQHSDTYEKDLKDYERIQNSGDVNALAIFVAHHPFVVEALLQLAMVLYRTNQSQKGLALLRRSLWILESSSISSFRVLQKSCFMDYDQPENASYFLALFRMIQISGMAGCIRTSLAVSRYLLALDPLRDPMGVLLLMDFFALACLNDNHDEFLIRLVESRKISLNYRDESSREEYCGDLMELPNWAYSYALALYRRSQSNIDGATDKCDEALRSAIRKFPAVVEQLLIKNEVDVSGRSMRSDWPTVLRDLRTYVNNPVESENYNPITQHAARQASNLVTKIFVQRSYSLWSGDKILMWLYRNCTSLLFLEGDVESLGRLQLSPSLIRYARCDPADYEDRFQTLPIDANPLDPGLLAPALAVDPNRRRFLRRADMLARHQEDADLDILPVRGVFGGPPTHMIDPDSPLMEVFWRSMLPWNHVNGVPPPRR